VTPSRAKPSTAAVVVALLIVYVVWGSTYLAIAVMIETMPPLLAAGVRYGIAGLIMLGGIALFRRLRRGGAPHERPTATHWRSAAIIGILLLLGGNGGVVLAELLIDSGMAAVLVAMLPMSLAVMDAIVTRRPPSRLVIGGLAAGIVGVVILLVPVEGVEGLNPLGVALALGAEFSWALGSIYARHAPQPRSNLLGTGMEMLAGGVALVVAGALLGEIGRTDVTEFSTRSLIAITYLIVFGSIIAFTAYTWLLANVPVSTVATYAYVNPIVAVALGAIILEEPITVRRLVAAAIIIGAVALMVSGRPRDADDEGAAAEVVAEPEAAQAR
jgi:drug/metabolite transporter (DMT)-like permease